MEIKFLGQGLISSSETVGDILIKSLNDDRYNRFISFVAFVTEGGINRIIDPYNNFSLKSGNTSKMFIGVDQKGTPKDALDLLLKLGHDVFVYHNSNNNVIFHPKIYIFSGKDHFRIILGSSNLTVTGLFQNFESSTLIEFNASDEKGQQFMDEIESFFKGFLDKTSPNLKKLTEEVIEKLVSSGKVPQKSQHSVIHKKSGGIDELGIKDIKDLFPDSGSPKAPERTISPGASAPSPSSSPSPGASAPSPSSSPSPGASAPSPSSSPSPGASAPSPSSSPSPGASVPSPSTSLSPGIPTASPGSRPSGGVTLWFESGKLTGGSANILDLSLTGKKGGSGGVQLFNTTLTNNYPITIRYRGNDYFGNLVKYPVTASGKSNGTWRLQLKGKTTAGEKFTNHTRMGQLKDKILVFKEISSDHYSLVVEPATRLGHYKGVSSFVEQSPPRGRFYGKL